MREICSILVVMLLGSTVVLGSSMQAGQDSWLSILLATALVMPMALVYARLMKLMPGLNLYDMLETVFGKVGGKVCTAIFTWYSLSLGSMVLRNFSEYIKITLLPKTPEIIIMMAMIFITFYLVHSGTMVLGKFSSVIIIMILILMALTVFMCLPNMDVENLKPFFEHSSTQIISGTISTAAFPFGEIVLTLVLMRTANAKDSSYKVFIWSIAISGFLLCAVFLRNVMILGEYTMSMAYFPSFSTARIISMGSLLERFDALIAIFITLSGYVKLGVCLFAAAKGFSKLFSLKSHRTLLFPTTMLMWALCTILYRNIMEIMDFVNIYPLYALPYQVVIPLLLWICAEIKFRNGHRQPIAQSH